MKYTFATLVVLAAILMPQAAKADDPKIILVDDNKVECPKAAATELQQAVNLANPGDLVQVCPGTYAGGVIIAKAGLSLKAKGDATPKILGTDGTGPKFGVVIVADNVRIEGFEISHFGGREDSAGVFVGGLAIGDTAHPANNAIIENNLIHDNGNGVYLWQSNGNRIKDNTIHHQKNVKANEGNGIISFVGTGDAQVTAANSAERSGLGNQILNNTIRDNERRGIFVGACTDTCAANATVHALMTGTRINKNTLTNNGSIPVSEAIGVSGASGVTISKNTVTNNTHHGILAIGADHIDIQGNIASNNGVGSSVFAGIRLHRVANSIIKKNTTDGNGRGIRVTTSDGLTIKSIQADANELFDLDWDGAGTQTFRHNTCTTASPSTAAWDC